MHLSALAWRSLASRPLRTALTVLGVALGVAVITAALMAGQAATEAVRRAAQELLGRPRSASAPSSREGFTPRAVQHLQTIPGVNTGSAVIEERGRSVTTRPGPDEKVFTMLLIGVDPGRGRRRSAPTSWWTATSIRRIRRGAGQRRLGARQRPRLGDELWLNQILPDRLNHIVGLLGDAGFGALGPGSVVVLDSNFLSETFEVPAPIRYVDLKVAEGAEDQVLAALDRTMTEPFVVETVADAERSDAAPQPAVCRARLPVRAGRTGGRCLPGRQHAGHDPGGAHARSACCGRRGRRRGR